MADRSIHPSFRRGMLLGLLIGWLFAARGALATEIVAQVAAGGGISTGSLVEESSGAEKVEIESRPRLSGSAAVLLQAGVRWRLGAAFSLADYKAEQRITVPGFFDGTRRSRARTASIAAEAVYDFVQSRLGGESFYLAARPGVMFFSGPAFDDPLMDGGPEPFLGIDAGWRTWLGSGFLSFVELRSETYSYKAHRRTDRRPQLDLSVSVGVEKRVVSPKRSHR